MQLDVLITTAGDATVVTAIIDIAVQTINSVNDIAGDNITVMAFSDAGVAEAQELDNAKVKAFLEKRETTINQLAADVALWGYETKVKLANGTLGSVLATQSITFPALASLAVGAADRAPGATASSGLTVTYVSSNTSVATIVAGKIHAVAAGTSNITASQAGNGSYAAAPSVVRSITITAS